MFYGTTRENKTKFAKYCPFFFFFFFLQIKDQSILVKETLDVAHRPLVL